MPCIWMPQIDIRMTCSRLQTPLESVCVHIPDTQKTQRPNKRHTEDVIQDPLHVLCRECRSRERETQDTAGPQWWWWISIHPKEHQQTRITFVFLHHGPRNQCW